MLSLVTPATNNILAFTYSRFWYPETFNSSYTLVAVDLAAPEPLWSTADNWRPSRTPFGTPGLAEPTAFTNARITADRMLLVDALGLEDPVELWMSEDLASWIPCDPDAWTRAGRLFSINLQHPSLAAKPQCFFQLRPAD